MNTIIKNIFKALAVGFVWLLAISILGPNPPGTQPDAARPMSAPPMQTEATAKGIDVAAKRSAVADEMVPRLFSIGLVTRIDIEKREVFIDAAQWALSDVSDKEATVRMLSWYSEAQTHSPLITLRDSRSGKPLASYRTLTGVRIEK